MAKSLSLGDKFKAEVKEARFDEQLSGAAGTLQQWVGQGKSLETSGKIGAIAGMFGVSGKGPDGSDLRDVGELIKRLEKKEPRAAKAIAIAYRH